LRDQRRVGGGVTRNVLFDGCDVATSKALLQKRQPACAFSEIARAVACHALHVLQETSSERIFVKYFEFDDGSSSKFWAVTKKESTLIVRFGKIGSQGQTSEKDCGSPAFAKKQEARLVAEKTKKGYVEAVPEPR
jgi:predicted DNA-binding WGR domain protein